MTRVFHEKDWERYATCYDSLLHLTPYIKMLREIAELVCTLPCGPLLDASCGTGNFELIFNEMSSVGTRAMVGVDAANHMLNRAREKCARWPQCSFQAADLNRTLFFTSNTFSQVVSLNTLYAVHKPEKTLQEFYRVLAPGGKLLLVTPHEGYENGLILKEHCNSTLPDSHWAHIHESAEREETLIREAFSNEQTIDDMLTIAYFNRNIAHNAPFHFFNDNSLIGLVEEVGFTVETASRVYAKQDIFITATKGA